MSATAKKWTKTDIQTLCKFLESFWLVHRPLDYLGWDEAKTKFRAFVAEPRNRKEIVLAGIREARARCSLRYSEYCQTVGNQLVRFTEYGKPDELIERFTRLAREEDAANRKLETLLHRVLDEELPAEVLAHDPTSLAEHHRGAA